MLARKTAKSIWSVLLLTPPKLEGCKLKYEL